MYWIYILKCENNKYYVGQTKRLFRRFWEHESGRGGKNTSINCLEEVVAIYKASVLINFNTYNQKIIDLNNNNLDKYFYNNGFYNPKYLLNNWNDLLDGDYTIESILEAENDITECLMIHNKNNWTNYRGGKYIRDDVEYEFPFEGYLKELPLCKCGLPCDIRKNEENNYLFFRCAKKNFWNSIKDEFDLDEPCNFFKKYTLDEKLINEERKQIGEKFNKPIEQCLINL